MIHDPWSGSWKSHDPDQISHQKYLIWIKFCTKIFWSGSKIWWKFFDPDQKFDEHFLIRIKNCVKIFWSGSKITWKFFDPDQKYAYFFLIRTKNSPCFFWSGSKILKKFLIQDQKIWILIQKVHGSKNDPRFWSMISQACTIHIIHNNEARVLKFSDF